MSCRGDLEIKNFRYLKIKFEASKTTHGMHCMHCSSVLYTEFSIISQNFLWFENLCGGRRGGGTKTPLNIRVLPTCKKNLDAAEAS